MSEFYHDFDERLREGEAWELELDEYFARQWGWKPYAASRREQQRGIDRWVQTDGQLVSLQYKGDRRAASTKHCFIETVHCGTGYVAKGWSYLCEATYLVIYVPPLRAGWIGKTDDFRAALDRWLHEYDVKIAANKNYWTYGIRVPFAAIEATAIQRLDISVATA